MRWRFGALLLVCATAGCSSSAQLLKDGDPHVCAASDVKEQLFAILKENAGSPISATDEREFGLNHQTWLDKIDLSIDNITSTNVDKSNQQITCNATVHGSSNFVEQKTSASVDYKVVSDFSSGKIVVSSDVSNAYAIFYSLMRSISQADLAGPLKKRADDAKIRNDAITAAQRAKDDAFNRANPNSALTQPNEIMSNTAQQKPAEMQMPCKVEGHQSEKGCILVYKYLSGDNPGMQHLEIDPMLARALQGKVNGFSVIYEVQMIPGGLNSDGSASVEFGGHWVSSDVSSNKPTFFWVTTRDSGKSWSRPMTTDMSGALTD